MEFLRIRRAITLSKLTVNLLSSTFLVKSLEIQRYLSNSKAHDRILFKEFTRTRLSSSTYHESWRPSISDFKYQASTEKMTENKAYETRVFELHCKRTMCTYSILAGDLSQEEQLRNINVFCVLLTGTQSKYFIT